MFKTLVQNVGAALLAAQIYGIIQFCVKVLKRPVRYGELSKALGLSSWWGEMANALTFLARLEHEQGKPLSATAVIGETGWPGWGLYAIAGELGLIPAPTVPASGKANYQPTPVEEAFVRDQWKKLGL